VTHKPSLSLRTGGDRLLCLVSGAAGIGGALAFALSEAPWWWQLAGIWACVMAGLLAGRKRAAIDDATLRVRPDGQAEWLSAGRLLSSGILFEQAWVTPKYAVIRCRMQSKTLSFLVSRSRQRHGEYRALLAWLYLGFPERETES
jgi:hypothetical protein